MARATYEINGRCPYCEQVHVYECVSVENYNESLECWYCGGVFIVQYKIVSITASVMEVLGEKDRVEDKLESLSKIKAADSED